MLLLFNPVEEHPVCPSESKKHLHKDPQCVKLPNGRQAGSMTQRVDGKGRSHKLQLMCRSGSSVQLLEGSEVGTHRVGDGVGVGVGDPGHLPLARAHVGGGDVDARPW